MDLWLGAVLLIVVFLLGMMAEQWRNQSRK